MNTVTNIIAMHWVNHDLYYCDPSDPSINTNMIEGLWAQIKRWLPRAGSYNLTEYLDLFQWFYQQKLNGKMMTRRRQRENRRMSMKAMKKSITGMIVHGAKKSGFKRSPEMTIWSSVAKRFKHRYLYS